MEFPLSPPNIIGEKFFVVSKVIHGPPTMTADYSSPLHDQLRLHFMTPISGIPDAFYDLLNILF
jgi:hypothetical protein